MSCVGQMWLICNRKPDPDEAVKGCVPVQGLHACPAGFRCVLDPTQLI